MFHFLTAGWSDVAWPRLTCLVIIVLEYDVLGDATSDLASVGAIDFSPDLGKTS